MIESWRWFGPLDKIDLTEIYQTGSDSVVTALHDISYGEIWPLPEIEKRKAMVEAAGLTWSVVESLPVHEDIKLGRGNTSYLFNNYRKSLENLAKCGVGIVCYNFMPLLDWTRTNLDAPADTGGSALRFSMAEMAAFDVFVLKRKEAKESYSEEVLKNAEELFKKSDQKYFDKILRNIMAGLPGSYARYSTETLREVLKNYEGFIHEDLRMNYQNFLREIIPTATDCGIRMCVHPDDPPWDVFGIPRVVSTKEDISFALDSVPVLENGLTLCSGSLGAHPNNDVVKIASSFSERIHFAHLRNVKKEPDGSFQESSHLKGDVNMVELIKVLLKEEKKRKLADVNSHEIIFRPDHGHEILSDGERNTHPGYPLLGRMKGLAELRGVSKAIQNELDLL
ncbi:MAG: mannonate dehydratase [Paracoccaceae bacterium]|nr:mannonate dehydratase [Paracoccaceae bacterium]